MKFFLPFFFLLSFTGLAQTEYHFDHFLEYRYKNFTDSDSNKKVYYFTNSKNNSYYAQFEEMDSLHFKVVLVEQDRLRMEVTLKKSDVYEAANLSISCLSTWDMRNPFKFRTREYAFSKITDTLYDGVFLRQYRLIRTAPRTRKTKHVGSNQYIIKDSTDFHLPLLIHPTAFEEWKEEKNIPNGIFQEKIFYNHDNEIQYKYILQAYHPINKSVIVNENCMRQ